MAEFWSKYEIVYDKNAKSRSGGKKTRIQTLQNNKGYIRRRSEMAILRYYLNYNNDEDLARGLLILFMPYRNEMHEIHQKDVKALLHENKDIVKVKREQFEKYKVMTDLISKVQSNSKENDTTSDDEDNESFQDLETTDMLSPNIS